MITTKLKNNKKLIFSIIFALVMVCSFIKLCDLIALLLSEERGIFICSIAFLVEVIVYSIFSIFIVNKTNTLEKQETSLLFNRLLTSALIGFAFFLTPLISQLSQLPVPCTVQPEFNLLLALLAAFTVVSFWGGSYIYTKRTFGSLLQVLWLFWLPVSIASEIFLVARTLFFKS